MSETCPASQGRGEGYSVHTDESEGLSVPDFIPSVSLTADSSPCNKGSLRLSKSLTSMQEGQMILHRQKALGRVFPSEDGKIN